MPPIVVLNRAHRTIYVSISTSHFLRSNVSVPILPGSHTSWERGIGRQRTLSLCYFENPDDIRHLTFRISGPALFIVHNGYVISHSGHVEFEPIRPREETRSEIEFEHS